MKNLCSSAFLSSSLFSLLRKGIISAIFPPLSFSYYCNFNIFYFYVCFLLFQGLRQVFVGAFKESYFILFCFFFVCFFFFYNFFFSFFYLLFQGLPPVPVGAF